ncbi:MAG: DUF1670 domain-containing protein [Nitrospirae bacterium]|nr:DUF1670 domain-containing protein [Nitrospirota bacterium]
MKGNLIYWVRESRNSLKSLKLTIWSDGDSTILNRWGLAELRRQRMLRLLEEAKNQGARLSYKDLSLIMLTSKATLKRDSKITLRDKTS